MSENNTKPNVEQIISSLRQGMDDTTPFDETLHTTNAQQKLKFHLRKAAESANTLGRCDGSLRGRLCKKLAYIALPVIEQLDIYHNAVINALKLINTSQTNILEDRICKLEEEIEALKTKINS